MLQSDYTKTLAEISVAGLTITPEYDILKRNKGKEISSSGTRVAGEYISYRKVGDHATNMPASVYFGSYKAGRYALNEHLKYAYDEMGNVSKVYENGELVVRYAYDKLNRLVREDNKVMDKTVLYVYDNNGNILKQRVFAFTLKNGTEIEELESTDKAYIYDGDRLLSYNEEICEYEDLIGNPKTYRGKAATWAKDRRLMSYDGHTFAYDAFNRRISKDSIEYAYDSEERIIKQSNGLEFFYDHTGVAGVKYSDATYLYRKDVQGNIIALLNGSGEVVARYVYDAWGNHAVVDTTGVVISDGTHIGNLNPFRYRGYYYDTETKLYYLKTRYYDPEIGRFITIDDISYLDPEKINGLNLYAYCGNNPVMRTDSNGNAWWHWLLGVVAVVALAAVIVVSAVATSGASLVAIGIGFAIGAATSFLGQGLSNIQNGNNFFDNMNLGSILLGGLAGAAFATGLGGVAGAFGIGVAASVATASFQKKSLKEIVYSGLIGGLSAAAGYGLSQALGCFVYKNNGLVFADYFAMAKVDGAGMFQAAKTAFASAWYKFLPSISLGFSRSILSKIGANIFDEK